jgi:hypothetical protein
LAIIDPSLRRDDDLDVSSFGPDPTN